MTPAFGGLTEMEPYATANDGNYDNWISKNIRVVGCIRCRRAYHMILAVVRR